MSPNEYKELVDFLGGKFGAIDQRFERMEGEVRGVRVLVEENASQLRKVAEGVTANTARLDRFQEEVRDEFANVRGEMKVGFDAVHARVERVERELADTRGRMDAGFEGVHARMDRFEGELDPRKAARRR